ncbi:MAG: hypothetical protein ACKOPK_22210, partial [Dolichospermum sp.]
HRRRELNLLLNLDESAVIFYRIILRSSCNLLFLPDTEFWSGRLTVFDAINRRLPIFSLLSGV